MAGGGAGGDALDRTRFGPGASLRSAPTTQASFPVIGIQRITVELSENSRKTE